MVIPDANLIIYAHNPTAKQHRAAAEWLSGLLGGRETVGLPWMTLWAFLRISTNAKLWKRPVPAEDVFNRISEWQGLSNVVIVEPGHRHRQILERLVVQGQALGTMASDAALAAIAIEHAATLASTDRDFRKFSGLRWVNPLE